MSNPSIELQIDINCGPGETDDGFLGGQLNIIQPRKGYRAGLDAVMIAAAIPAKPGERIIEAGLGTGVASLCLMKQVPDLTICGLEINPDYADLARRNAGRDSSSGNLHVIEGDIAMPPANYAKYNLDVGSFAHAFANPPYRRESGSRAGSDPGRNRAHLLSPGGLALWTKFLLAMVSTKGTISLILPADMLDEALTLLKGRAGDVLIFPLFPKQHEPAKRIILQATKASRAPLTLLPGLILHDTDGSYTKQANAILRGNDRLSLVF